MASNLTGYFCTLCFLLIFNAQAETLVDLVDQNETQKLMLADAVSDFKFLKQELTNNWGYLDFYQNRFNINLSNLVDQKILSLSGINQQNQVHQYEFRAAVAETTGRFRDAHSYMTLKGNAKLTLNIGLSYIASTDEYLVYKANDEIYQQLKLSPQEFEKMFFILKEINGIPVSDIISEFDEVLPYTNMISRKSYAGVMLATSKGVLYLANLIKQKKLPNFPAVFSLKIQSQSTGSVYTVSVNPQPLADWHVSDLWGKIEGRSSSIVFPDFKPETVANLFGWESKEIRPNVHYLKIPSWAPDLVNATNTVATRQALYQFILMSLSKIDLSASGHLILNLHGNRGGDTILWRPIVEKVMAEEAAVIGILQLNSQLMNSYSQFRALSPVDSISRSDYKDYIDYSYFREDSQVGSAMKKVMLDKYNDLVSNQIITDDQIVSDPRFSKILFSVVNRSEPKPFLGKVYVIIDRFGFSANDTLVSALKSVLPSDRLVIVGERTEGGSGSGGKIKLPLSKLTMNTGAFLSFDSWGRLYEADIIEPDLPLEVPLQFFYEKDEWLKRQVLDLVDQSAKSSVR